MPNIFISVFPAEIYYFYKGILSFRFLSTVLEALSIAARLYAKKTLVAY